MHIFIEKIDKKNSYIICTQYLGSKEVDPLKYSILIRYLGLCCKAYLKDISDFLVVGDFPIWFMNMPVMS